MHDDNRPLTYEELYGDGPDGTVANGDVVEFEVAARQVREKKAASDAGVPGAARVVEPPSDPMPNARAFVQDHYRHDEHARLVHHGGVFKHWTGDCWPELDDRALRAAMYTHFEGAVYVNAKGEEAPFRPTQHKVADLVDALRAVVHVPTSLATPVWLRGAVRDVSADEVVSCENGLLHIPSRKLYSHTPRFFVHHSVPFPFEPAAPAPQRWLALLDDLWSDDEQAKTTLAEIVGYLVAGDTRQQKIFGLIGPRRSGKAPRPPS